MSDLHLSLAGMEVMDTDADVVILAGDVARPQEAAAWARRIGKPVVYVPGNHEYYHGDLRGTLAELRLCCTGSNVHVLECDSWTFGGVRFLGATLWSDFRIFADHEIRAQAMATAVGRIRDFQRIAIDRDRGEPFTPPRSRRHNQLSHAMRPIENMATW